jgi:AraC-like DNA-binding protein/mannose-6-phosphate isomerase-like protein (cupin superfamily)
LSTIDVQATPSAEYLSVRRWQAGKEWCPAAHSHQFCEIVVVVRGKERAMVGGVPYTCEPGQVLFYPPGCRHEERQDGDVLLEFFCVEFEWNDRPEGIPSLIHDRQGRILEITRWLVSEEHVTFPGKEHYQDLGARMLTGEIMRLVMNPAQDAVGLVQNFIHEHYSEPLTLDDLAECCNLNKFHLARVFRTRTGVTPMEYVRQARLDIALRLLLESDLPLREIAPRVGISDEYHLSRLLKARYGRGARELRRSK